MKGEGLAFVFRTLGPVSYARLSIPLTDSWLSFRLAPLDALHFGFSRDIAALVVSHQDIFDHINDWLATLPHGNWILCGDFNFEVTDSNFSRIFDAWFGTLMACGCHSRGTKPIDAMVVGPAFACSWTPLLNFRFGSDHECLGTCLPSLTSCGPPNMRLS